MKAKMLAFSFFVICTAALSSTVLNAKPLMGIQYSTWFDYGGPRVDKQIFPAGSGCAGNGWGDHPFQLDEVRSLAFSPDPNGFCYSSLDPHTAEVHANLFKDLGVDFVIFDESNFSKMGMPEANPTYKAAKIAMEGFRRSPYKVRTVFQLGITCWGEQCFNRPGDRKERYTYNSYVEAHITDIAHLAKQYPDDFIYEDGKPILLFYISTGEVWNLDDTRAFRGPGGLVPRNEDFNPTIMVNGAPKALRDIFTVKYSIVANSDFDYRPYSVDLWPFECVERCRFADATYLSVSSKKEGRRSMDIFRTFLYQGTGRKYYIIRNWNEFSSTDELPHQAFTLEPNTALHKYDGTPGNQDPWHFFNTVKAFLKPLRQ